MLRVLTRLTVASVLALLLASNSHAVRIMTNLPTGPGKQFDNIALTPDGTKIVTTGRFGSAANDRVYSLPVPADPNTETATLTQLSTNSFIVPAYDVDFPPVISPDGQTILFTHNGNAPTVSNTIYTMPISGEGSANFTGFFGANPNLASPGDGNSFPIFSPNGSTVFFLNKNASFDGATIPDFSSPSDPKPWLLSGPDWDRIYSVPAGGGTPTPVTAPDDGDIDEGLFKVTPDGLSIVYAPDNPVIERKDRADIRPKLFTIPTTGGSSTEIPIPAPNHDFSIATQLEVTADGQSVLFIGDYESLGKNELFSVPITGGTPQRISDDLPWSGDVNSFAIAPNGIQVAYVAGQNTSANSELFLTPITGGTGNSVRVSEPAPSNSGAFDVLTLSKDGTSLSDGGPIIFSNDSARIYYLGDLDTDEVNDLYVVDTTEKAGLVPSPYFYTGPSGGDFFDESNWNDDPNGSGNSLPSGSIDPGVRIQQSLIIDGDTVSSGPGVLGGKAIFEAGSSLEMTPGSVLDFPLGLDEIEFLFGSGFKLTDASVSSFGDIFFHGTTMLSGGTITSTDDDIEFQDANDSTINGTTFVSTMDNILFDNSLRSVTGATFVSNDRLGLRHEVDISMTDAIIDVDGGFGDVEDIFGGVADPAEAQGEGSTLILKGASTLLADGFEDGVSLVLDGTSVATLLGNTVGTEDLIDPNGTITFMSTAAEMITLNASASDVRSLIINGFTGMSYFDDPNAWTVTDWDGLIALPSLQLVGIPGDVDGDNDVDGVDFLIIQRTDPSLIPIWEVNYGMSIPLTGSLAAVPEPGSLALLGTSFTAFLAPPPRSAVANERH